MPEIGRFVKSERGLYLSINGYRPTASFGSTGFRPPHPPPDFRVYYADFVSNLLSMVGEYYNGDRFARLF